MGFDKAIPTKNLDRQAWLDLRNIAGIGGSEVSTIFGINRYQSPVELWQRKTGKTPIVETSSDPAYWGQVLEDLVAKEYSKRTGDKIQNCNYLLKRGAQTANIDRFVLNGSEKPFVKSGGKWVCKAKKVLECKTGSEYVKDQWGESGTDDIPLYYLLQVQQYMDLLDAKECDVAVLFGGNDFRIYTVKYDPVIAKGIEDRVNNFWNNHVLTDTPPDPVNMDEVRQLYARARRESLVADDQTFDTYERLKDTKKKIKALTDTEKELKNEIAVYLGDKEDLLDLDGNKLVTWREEKNPRKTTNWKKVMEDLGLSHESPVIAKHTTEAYRRTFSVK